MIKECNFKIIRGYFDRDKDKFVDDNGCSLNKCGCIGEDNCILYQIYQELNQRKKSNKKFEKIIREMEESDKKMRQLEREIRR